MSPCRQPHICTATVSDLASVVFNRFSLRRLSWQRLSRLLFLPRCWNCGLLLDGKSHQPYFCYSCFTELPWQETPPPWPRNLRDNRRRHLDGIWSALAYQPPVQSWIWNFKYHRQDQLAYMLGWLLAQASLQLFSKLSFQIVLPVPLHPSRVAWRGFNQSQLLARCWLKHLSVENSFSKKVSEPLPEINTHLLQRVQPTKPQMELSLAERAANVRDAFAPANHKPNLSNKCILLVDDVFTSGNTLNACAKTLKSMGASEVWGFTLAWRP